MSPLKTTAITTSKEYHMKKNSKNTAIKQLKKSSYSRAANMSPQKKNQNVAIIKRSTLSHHSVKNSYKSSSTLHAANFHIKNFHTSNTPKLSNKMIMPFFVKSFKRPLKCALKLATISRRLIMCCLEKYSSVSTKSTL